MWIDDVAEQKRPHGFTLLGSLREERNRIIASTKTEGNTPLVLMPVGWHGAMASGHMSPVMSKLFQESELRQVGGRASINPVTARRTTLEEGDAARIHTGSGTLETTMHLDPSVRPDVIVVSVGPLPNGVEATGHPGTDGVLTMCDITEEGTWRVTPATIEKV